MFALLNLVVLDALFLLLALEPGPPGTELRPLYDADCGVAGIAEALRLPFLSSLNHSRREVRMLARLIIFVPTFLALEPAAVLPEGRVGVALTVSRLGALWEWGMISPRAVIAATLGVVGPPA